VQLARPRRLRSDAARRALHNGRRVLLIEKSRAVRHELRGIRGGSILELAGCFLPACARSRLKTVDIRLDLMSRSHADGQVTSRAVIIGLLPNCAFEIVLKP
jgi:hypothetical protein